MSHVYDMSMYSLYVEVSHGSSVFFRHYFQTSAGLRFK